jgi:acyl-CoA dehydrogenase
MTVDPLRSQVRRLTADWRSDGRYVARSDAWLRSFDLDFSRELGRLGLIGMTWPQRYGGGGRSNRDRLAVTEELLRAGAPVAAHWIGDRQIGPSILRHGTDELRDEILPKIIDVSAVFCLGMSEPEAGSDLAAVRTRATPVDGGWRLRGRKIWTSQAHRATHAYVLARTDDGPSKHHGLTEFVVDLARDVSMSPIVDLSGSHHFNEVLFEDTFVPAHRVIGEVGNGWRQVVEQLSFERGGAERVLSTYPVLVELIGSVELDARGQQVLGGLVARLGVLRRLCWQVAGALDDDQAPVQEAAALKFLGNAFEVDVLEACRDLGLAGAAGPDDVFGQALLASPGFGLRGGSSEVLLSIIAKQEARGA